jgi:hypothetical protein
LSLIFLQGSDAQPGPTQLPEQATEPGRVKRLKQMPYDDPDDEPWAIGDLPQLK